MNEHLNGPLQRLRERYEADMREEGRRFHADGWRSDQIVQLMAEYGFDEEDARYISAEMRNLEAVGNGTV